MPPQRHPGRHGRTATEEGRLNRLANHQQWNGRIRDAMKRACLLAALLAILLPVGCSNKDVGLSGTYEGRCVWNGIDSTMTFHDDGTFESKSPTEVITGTYKLEGRKLSITVTEVNG